MPTPRPASSVTVSAVEKPGREDQVGEFGIGRCRVRLDQTHGRGPWRGCARGPGRAPSSRNSTPTSLPSCESETTMVPVASLPASRARLRRLDAVRDAVAQQVLEGAGHAVEHAAVDFDRAADDVQPHLLAGLLGGLAHDAVQAVGQCSRTRPCACAAGRPAGRASGAPGSRVRPRSLSSARCSVRCTVATSLTDSAIMRVSSWKRVKRSNSSGSKDCDIAFAASSRELICVSACSSMSRSCRRRRSRFSVRSPSEPLIWPTSDSMRERVMRHLAGLVHEPVEQRRTHAHRRLRGTLCALDDDAAGGAGQGEARPVDRSRLGSVRRGGRGRRAVRRDGGLGLGHLDGGSATGRLRARHLGQLPVRASASAGATGAAGAGSGAARATGAGAACREPRQRWPAHSACASRARSASKTCASASPRDCSCSTSAAAIGVCASSCSMRVSRRCAISPRRIAPARRAPPLSVCSVRMQAAACAVSPGLRAQSRSFGPPAAAAGPVLLPRRSGTVRHRPRRPRRCLSVPSIATSASVTSMRRASTGSAASGFSSAKPDASKRVSSAPKAARRGPVGLTRYRSAARGGVGHRGLGHRLAGRGGQRPASRATRRPAVRAFSRTDGSGTSSGRRARSGGGSSAAAVAASSRRAELISCSARRASSSGEGSFRKPAANWCSRRRISSAASTNSRASSGVP